jgi:hypothetical protein
VGTVEASNDGLYWTPVTGFSVPFRQRIHSSAATTCRFRTPRSSFPRLYVRFKFVMVAESAAATALLHADIRTYRAS